MKASIKIAWSMFLKTALNHEMTCLKFHPGLWKRHGRGGTSSAHPHFGDGPRDGDTPNLWEINRSRSDERAHYQPKAMKENTWREELFLDQFFPFPWRCCANGPTREVDWMQLLMMWWFTRLAPCLCMNMLGYNTLPPAGHSSIPVAAWIMTFIYIYCLLLRMNYNIL